jgi:hypothetical protein
MVEGVLYARLAQPVLDEVRIQLQAIVAGQAAPRDRVEEGARRDEIVGQQLSVKPARPLLLLVRRKIEGRHAEAPERLKRDRVAIRQLAPPVRLRRVHICGHRFVLCEATRTAAAPVAAFRERSWTVNSA